MCCLSGPPDPWHFQTFVVSAICSNLEGRKLIVCNFSETHELELQVLRVWYIWYIEAGP